MTAKNTHGGRRPGAGRKPLHGTAKISTSMALTPEVRQYLSECDQSAGETVEAAIRRTKAFREWQKGAK